MLSKTLRSILNCLLLWLAAQADQSFDNDEIDGKIYTNSWAVQLYTHEESVADKVARSFGFENRGAIGNLAGYFNFVHGETGSRQKRSADHHTQSLLAHPRVRWAKQQTLLFRYKRGFEALEQNLARIRRTQKNREYFDDPEWPKQWYLYDNGFDEASGNLGVLEAAKRGFTGQGVVVSIVDDGLDHRHPDLRANYDPEASRDVNDNDDDPIPDDSNLSNAHGTECGGEVAAAAGNGICGVGVAYNASIGGIRMLDGTVTDAVEAEALGYKCDYIDIKSASWGPKDDGKTFGRPSELAKRVMENCILHGRQGKGAIYVWATGNGGRTLDDCSCDGYTSSIYTLSVGSISPGGFCTSYDEKCPSTMGVVYTGDVGVSKREKYRNLVTTSLFGKCVDRFSGTSCAAPLAAGIFAQVLQANPNLTWRDMQHLVVKTARKNDPDGLSWNTNAAGHKYSRCYGFGVLNAMDLINKAKDWEQVDEKLTHKVPGQLTRETREIPSNGKLTLKLRYDDKTVRTLEHVQLVLSAKLRRRGDMVIELTSPQGTTSQLLAKRPYDDSSLGIEKWPFTSVEFWDENPQGEWIVKIRDAKSKNSFTPRNKGSVLFDEEIRDKMRNEPDIVSDFTHGFREDYEKPGGFQQSDEPSLERELVHGRFKEDYMKLKADSSKKNNVYNDEPAMKDDKSKNSLSDQQMKNTPNSVNDFTYGFKEDSTKLADEPSFPRELVHGRFKEDYMKLKADSSETNNVESDESECSPSGDLQGDIAGCVTEWSMVMYGTA